MLETLMHLLGLCPDAHCHLDVFDLLAGGLIGSWSLVGFWLRVKVGQAFAARKGEDDPGRISGRDFDALCQAGKTTPNVVSRLMREPCRLTHDKREET